MTKPTIAVSACLLGERVRFDGQHKELSWIRDRLSTVASLFPVCPEVELGLGVPREPIQLELEEGKIRLRKVHSRTELTQEMIEYASQKIQALKQKLNGYILKSKSPSCGLQVKVLASEQHGKGLFAEQLTQQLPLLPVIEETSLSQEASRISFLTKVFSLFRLQEFWESDWSLESLSAFHRTHKLILMAYSPEHYQNLNQLLKKNLSLEECKARYDEEFQRALQEETSIEKHGQALQHVMGYFLGEISAARRYALQQSITEYQEQKTSLQEPLRMISEELKRCKIPYLMQHYFEPFPKELF
jgi:uncharacterized protein YbbK (DUF523 family)/uncharacterized protein YbgA (DUF1722 family)